MKVKAIKTKVTFPLGERSRQNLEWSLVIAAETADLNKQMWAYAKNNALDTLDDHFEKVFSGE